MFDLDIRQDSDISIKSLTLKLINYYLQFNRYPKHIIMTPEQAVELDQLFNISINDRLPIEFRGVPILWQKL